jgi:hypothetical protein
MIFADIIKFVETKAAGKSAIIEGKEALLVSPDDRVEISTLLKNESKLDFDYLMCISSYDKGDNKTYGAAYNLFSTLTSK